MFLLPKNNLKNFDPERSCFVLNEFAAAEFASAIEMLFAAKKVDNIKLSFGFIKHALDEYKHCFIFNNLKNQIIAEYKINNKEYNFVPHQIYNKGYIYKDHFIFEKKKINDFAIFIGANEEVAEKKLIDFCNHFKHHRPAAYNEIQKILEDEKRHSYYSLKFARKNNNFILFKFKMIKEKILSLFRHTYANGLNKISFIFNPILVSIILLIKSIINFLKLERNISDDDVMKSIDPWSLT